MGSCTRSCSRCARSSGSTRCARSSTWEEVRDDADAGRRARRGRPLRAVPEPVRRRRRRAPRARHAARRLPASRRAARRTSSSATRSPSSRRRCRSPACCPAVLRRALLPSLHGQALRRGARGHARRRLRERLLQGLQHRRGEPPARLLDGARRRASRATATSRRSTGILAIAAEQREARALSTPRRSRCASSRRRRPTRR